MIRKLFHSVRKLMTAKKKAATQGTRAHYKARALRCAKCKSTDVTVSGAQQMLRRGGAAAGKTLYARVTCANGHEWWSKNPAALKLSREVDQKRVENVGQPHMGT